MVAGRRIRFAAVLVAVVFALTGFSSHGGSSSGSGGKSSSKSGSKSSSGGGCSSSKSKKKSHSGGKGSTATASPSASEGSSPATAVVVTCAGATPPVTTVRFTSLVDRRASVSVTLYRENAAGAVIEQTVVRTTLEARGTRTVDVALKDPSRAAEVAACRLDRPTDGPAPAPSTSSSSESGSSSGGSKSTPKPKASKRRS
ncbi:hypothetical protein [Streptomyces sp. NPDC054849]